jgi:hypothetical protein
MTSGDSGRNETQVPAGWLTLREEVRAFRPNLRRKISVRESLEEIGSDARIIRAERLTALASRP